MSNENISQRPRSAPLPEPPPRPKKPRGWPRLRRSGPTNWWLSYPLAPPLGELACAARLRGYQRRNSHESLAASQPSQARRFRRASSPIGRAKGVLRWYGKPQHSCNPPISWLIKMPFSIGRTFDESKGALPNKSSAPLKMPVFTQPRCWVRRGWRSSRECGCIFRSGLCTGTAPDRPGCR